MNHPSLFVKAATVTSSLLLGIGFVMYHTRDLDRFLPFVNSFPTDVTLAQQANMFEPNGTDTSEIHRRLLLLDSTQRAFLGLLSGQFPPPEGTGYFDREYLDSLLTQAGRRSLRFMLGSSKSGSVIRAGESGFRMIDSIRMILLSDTARLDRKTMERLADTSRFRTISVTLEELIYPEAAGSEDRMKRLIDSFPMSPLGIFSANAVPGIDTLGIADTTSGRQHR